ncbi:hypothetical protein CEP54_001458 [Fusarium duplospermum]|uniref:Uncharacterized protein n=1 Tax=Fusarium duplospermum TaxID=1325734 RepID=A0A428R088_9HYPO|nr:hypothetical protein CEP54_001458 [Fusarium duplospermum]
MPSKKNTINHPPGPRPPRPPPDLLTMVKLVFSIRVNTVLRQRKEAEEKSLAEYYRLQDEEIAKIVVKPIRQAAKEKREAREAMEEMLRKPVPYIYRRPVLEPREKLTWTEIDRLMDDEVQKEFSVGLGLKRAEGETHKRYSQRMRNLEFRLDTWISIEYFRQQNGPLRYMDGMPVSLIAVHRHMWIEKIKESKPIPPLPAWHENDKPENVRDDEYQPKGWWNVLKDGLTEW